MDVLKDFCLQPFPKPQEIFMGCTGKLNTVIFQSPPFYLFFFSADICLWKLEWWWLQWFYWRKLSETRRVTLLQNDNNSNLKIWWVLPEYTISSISSLLPAVRIIFLKSEFKLQVTAHHCMKMSGSFTELYLDFCLGSLRMSLSLTFCLSKIALCHSCYIFYFLLSYKLECFNFIAKKYCPSQKFPKGSWRLFVFIMVISNIEKNPEKIRYRQFIGLLQEV